MTDILVPFEQEGTKAIVRSWLKKVGDTVRENDPLVELETDKVTQEVPAPAAGVLTEILLDTDAEAVPGSILGRLGEGATVASDKPGEAPSLSSYKGPGESAPQSSSVTNQVLSPSVRRAVLENEIDPASISGTGRGGRITRADVDEAVASRAAASALPVETTVSRPPETTVSKPHETISSESGVRSIPHDRMRVAIADNMLRSVTAAPHVTAVFEADFSAIMAHRRKNKPAFEKDGISLTFTAYFIAACVAAMRVAPAINSRWFDDRLEIYDRINIGVGTALGEKGLIVPVVHGAEQLSLRGIAGRLGDLVARARGNKLAAADVRGGSFTISNHGVSGSLFASPIIIAQPQSAILGIGKLEKRVVVREVDGMDSIQIRPMCYVSLTIDHRVVDGHQTNAWLSRFVEILENWSLDS